MVGLFAKLSKLFNSSVMIFRLFCVKSLIQKKKIKYHNPCPWYLGLKKIKLEETSKREMKNFQSISTIIFYITTHNFILRNAFNLALHEQKEINPLKLWKNNILLYSVVKKESRIFIKWCTYYLIIFFVKSQH